MMTAYYAGLRDVKVTSSVTRPHTLVFTQRDAVTTREQKLESVTRTPEREDLHVGPLGCIVREPPTLDNGNRQEPACHGIPE